MDPMNKTAFRRLFGIILSEAIRTGERATGLHADKVCIELHGVGTGGQLMAPDDAINLLYINESEFYQIVDVGMKAWERGVWRVFVRVSDHIPTSFERTWNTPAGNGPFKLIEPCRGRDS